ncbi:MAG: membrane integrity-associated transporter subunit PqiC [Desulfobulbaceae bacterium]|uniref:Membrane integrity-associated transporter subunit PqiC n=1 Tax=Candidatus Desulfatifera sulfidica TaxID=2841691 RepID=A0A8J6NCH3_9BACT|nr:membrane integrity-associated transporter subunit PqiC [Candidatus Desulfatifera sulfidica]
MRNIRRKVKHGRLSALSALLACAFLLLTSCSRTQPVRYYQLAAQEVNPTILPGSKVTQTDQIVLGIGPVQIPDYLDRPQLVTRLTPNQLHLADSHRWAEPLSKNIPRVLGENLSVLLGTDRILLHPWPSSSLTDYQLLVEVIRFENERNESARLIVRWSIKDADDTILLPEKRSSHRIVTVAQNQEELVVALNKALGSFCREVAQALTPLLTKPSTKS